jgi:CRISPR system Cascade subunit CasA
MIYGSNSSVVDDVVHDTLNLHAQLASRDAVELAGMVKSCVEAADAAALAVGNLAGDLVAAAGGDGTGPRSRARERLFGQLDEAFRRWLAGVSGAHDAVDLAVEWHEQANVITQVAAADLLANVSPACWEGRIVRGRILTAAHADNRFRLSLRKALPHAYAPAEPAAAPA